MEITEEELGILRIIRLNKLEKRIEIRRSWHFGRIKITFDWRSKNNLWGRFGGGWNWNMGFEAGGKTLILNLLIASLRLEIIEKPT